jgi:tetratricopeptide (TPR) repeat protein
MNDLINTIVVCLASWFWLWLLLGLACFLLMLPIVRERRRRSLDTKYRARAEAYAAFRKLAEDDPGKWRAFLHFLAVSFGADGEAWTVRDSKAALQAIGVSPDDTESVLALHREADAEDYSVQHPEAQLGVLNAVGKRILGLLGKTVLVLLLGMSSLPQTAKASDWSEAEQLFEQALAAQAGSDAAAALYAESALKFQATAESGERPGMAWYNAGNAWFQTGALGRSIAAYRQARLFRPFDSMLAENLGAARALALNDVPEQSAWWQQWPAVWLKAVLLVLILIFGVCVLGTLRYRRQVGYIACLAMLLLCCLTAGLWLVSAQLSGRQGVVIVDSVIARKGPSYVYAAVFNEPLHEPKKMS